MKITTKSLREATKKLAKENEDSSKLEDSEELSVLDSLRELEDIALDELDIEDNEEKEDGDSEKREPKKKEPADDDEKDEAPEIEDDSDEGDEEVLDDEDEEEEDDDEPDAENIEVVDDDEDEDSGDVEVVDDEEDEDEDDEEIVDESLLSDALGSIGQGIKGLVKLAGKGALVLIAGLGGSFLFGLPGLLLAVMIAFGLMGGTNESTDEELIMEGLFGAAKEKLKNVIGTLKKMDKKQLKALNDKAKSGKEGAKEVADMLKNGDIEKKVNEKHGDKNNRGWRKNKVRECDCAECDCNECDDVVEVTEAGDHGLLVVDVADIEWDTDEWDSEFVDSHDANVVDAPREVSGLEIDFDGTEPIEDAISDALEREYGYCVKDFTYDVVVDPGVDEDVVEIDEGDDLGSKLDELDGDELKKLNPDQKEKLKDLLSVDESHVANVKTPRQVLRILRESKYMKKNPTLRHATRKFSRMVAEGSMRPHAITRRLEKQIGGRCVSERRFCKMFAKAVIK